METYNIIINSLTNIGGTNQSNYQYTFDWGLIPDSNYEVSFKFSTAVNTENSILEIAIPDLGATFKTYQTIAPGVSSNYPNILGTVNSYDSLYYLALPTDNPPVYISNRPFNNNFTVYITDTAGALKNIGVNYILILSFKKI